MTWPPATTSKLIRFEGPLFFANASYLEDEINRRINPESSIRHFIISAVGINDMDASGEEMLGMVVQRPEKRRLRGLPVWGKRCGLPGTGKNSSARRNRQTQYLRHH